MVPIFISCSPKDREHRRELENHLSVMRHLGKIKISNDQHIGPGEDYEERIRSELDTAKVIILLVSSDFLESEKCYKVQATYAMDRREQNAALVIPVILRMCDWQGAPFGRLNAIPKDGKHVMGYPDLDEGFYHVALAIRGVVESLDTSATTPGTSATTLDTLATIPGPSATTLGFLRVPSAIVAPTPLALRSSNLRIRKVFRNHERYEFLIEAFEYITKHFENSLIELKRTHVNVTTNLAHISDARFEAEIISGNAISTKCHIWLEEDLDANALYFSLNSKWNTDECDAIVRVAKVGYTPTLELINAALFGLQGSDGFTLQGTAEFFWSLFFKKL